MKPSDIKPNSNYKDKYAHLIGQDAAVEAAKKTETNRNYGFGMFITFIARINTLSMNAIFDFSSE